MSNSATIRAIMRTTTSSGEVNRAGNAAIGSNTRSKKKEVRMVAYTCAKPLAVARIHWLPLVSARR